MLIDIVSVEQWCGLEGGKQVLGDGLDERLGMTILGESLKQRDGGLLPFREKLPGLGRKGGELRVGKDGELDLPGLRAHVDFLLSHRVDGIFVLGTTGEFYALSESEKQAVVADAVAHVGARSSVFVGTGAETTREVVRLTAMAQREGAAGVSVITPYFIKPSQAELIDHFRRVAESTSLPVVLYNNPATCGGVNIEPETVAKLAEVPNIIGIKWMRRMMAHTL